ncbi:ubiquinone/menaquinone biosynthesis methyltransferase [Pasteuria penetrans]|uniref:ubiquinone/menaquinone biosynthesis methyltransferase n=1 Tax=Pasteuria penetrans TaxID=86005 RepID=UPI000FC37278|nr:ubiquinone/menaquinone biosynthesis methyltransferase [Pasteuria penetrans]
MEQRDTGRICDLFDRIAPYYDSMNDALSLGMHRHWRREATRRLEIHPQHRILDLCCGTGMWTLASAQLATQGHVVGMDISPRMLERGRLRLQKSGVAERTRLMLGDVHRLPFLDRTFHRVTVGFGLRNVKDPIQVVREMIRVACPGGRIAILELHNIATTVGWRWLCDPYLRLIPSLGGRLIGQSSPYTWLSRSMQSFPSAHQFAKRLTRDTCLVGLQTRIWLGGVAALFIGRRPGGTHSHECTEQGNSTDCGLDEVASRTTYDPV